MKIISSGSTSCLPIRAWLGGRRWAREDIIAPGHKAKFTLGCAVKWSLVCRCEAGPKIGLRRGQRSRQNTAAGPVQVKPSRVVIYADDQRLSGDMRPDVFRAQWSLTADLNWPSSYCFLSICIFYISQIYVVDHLDWPLSFVVNSIRLLRNEEEFGELYNLKSFPCICSRRCSKIRVKVLLCCHDNHHYHQNTEKGLHFGKHAHSPSCR